MTGPTALPRLRPARSYEGVRTVGGATRVTVDGSPLAHAALAGADGAYDWGYAGPGGATQLAWALLADHLDDAADVRRWCDHFLHSVVRHLASQSWSLTSAEISAGLPVAAR
jgi:hypothetical protein